MWRGFDRASVSLRKILFVEEHRHDKLYVSRGRQFESPENPQNEVGEVKWINVKVGTLVPEVKTINPLTRRSWSAYKGILIRPFLSRICAHHDNEWYISICNIVLKLHIMSSIIVILHRKKYRIIKSYQGKRLN